MDITLFKLPLCALLIVIAQPSMAQTQFLQDPLTQMDTGLTDQMDIQARLSLVIPLGDRNSDFKRQSKLSIGLRTTRRQNLHYSFLDAEWMLRAPKARELKLGLTLEESPQFIVNDYVVRVSEILQADQPQDEEDDGLDTYDKTVLTVIGVSLAVIAGSAIAVSD